MKNAINRRHFIKTTTTAGMGISTGVVSASSLSQSAPSILHQKPESVIRLGVIGCGLRGGNHIAMALRRDDCEVTAICDIDKRMVERTQKLFEEAGKKQPTVIGYGERDYLQLLERSDVDAVLIATPWRWHTEQAVAAMQAGKYVGMEVSGAFSVDECWQLVNTHEATGQHLFFLENVCYRRDVMAILKMVREGLFGELIHLEGGYQHDLRGVKFNDGQTPYDSGVEFGEKGFSEARWRTHHSIYRNGDLYPTHGIGPVAQYININRGNRFLTISSVASKARGLHEYIINHPKGGINHPNAKQSFKLGDKVTSLLTTHNGETIALHHDTNLPRPYSLGFRVQGTKGLWMSVNKSIHLEGHTEKHRWEPAEKWLEQYDHPIWKENVESAKGASHGGMDYFLFDEFVACVKNQQQPPFDVYDAATWMAITPLSEQSIELGGQAMTFPDFTRGRWMHRQPIFAL